MNESFRNKAIALFIPVVVCVIITSGVFSSAFAQMLQLCDEDLSSVHASGFSNFSVTNGIATALLNINGSTYTEIDSMKLGYYNRGSNGWDEDWTNVDIGTSSTDVTFTGFYMEAKFTNIDNPATRTLDYVRIGTPELKGDVTAEFNSFTGDVGGSSYVRTDFTVLGGATPTSTITNNGAPNGGFFLELDRTTGFRMVFNNSTITHN